VKLSVNDLLVYSPGMQAREWGLEYSQIVDLTTALDQPISVAVLPVYYDRPGEFSYKPEFAILDVHQFDLVLLVDIEFRPQQELIAWIEDKGLSSWLLCVAGLTHNQDLQERVMYRPAWALNFLQWNQDLPDFPLERPFLFDCLCGTRRVHRDYVMLSMMQSELLEHSIVTYRDIFQGC